MGRGRHRFSASLHPHAVLHGSRRDVSRPRGRSDRLGAFSASGNENAPCFRGEDERSARKIALLCCGLFFVGAFLWFIPPMAMRVVYPELPRMGLPNADEAAYAVASLTLLPHGLIGVMLAAMFSATMANLSAQFNVKSGILTKDVYQSLFRKNAGEHELLVVGWVTTFLVGGATTVIAVIMAASGQSVFQIMLTFNTLMSLAYGPPALLGLVVRRTPPWSGLASSATGLILGMLGAFVY